MAAPLRLRHMTALETARSFAVPLQLIDPQLADSMLACPACHGTGHFKRTRWERITWWRPRRVCWACDCTGVSFTIEPAARPILRPRIVVLCGSSRFYDAFQQANYDLTMQGKIVLTIGFYPHAKAITGHGEGIGHNSLEKIALDELHKRKIDLADEVFVLNVDGYIGDSTRSEIQYAQQLGRPITYLEAVKA